MAHWVKYQTGMKVVGAKVRPWMKVGAKNADQVSLTTVIPAGLTGRCELEHPLHYKLTFRKDDGDNQHIWSTIKNLTTANLDAGCVSLYVLPSHISEFEVEIHTAVLKSTGGTAMGVRG